LLQGLLVLLVEVALVAREDLGVLVAMGEIHLVMWATAVTAVMVATAVTADLEDLVNLELGHLYTSIQVLH
jgi:hypothetical protein